MKCQFAAAAVAILAFGIAPSFAEDQKPQAPSTVDKGAAPNADDKAKTPKTTGAMNNAVGGSVATSPQDVKNQQEGKKTAAEGGGDQPGAEHRDISKESPKTTGAAPGAAGNVEAK